jgi:hypothetical protein
MEENDDVRALQEVLHACTFDNDPQAGLARLLQILKDAQQVDASDGLKDGDDQVSVCPNGHDLEKFQTDEEYECDSSPLMRFTSITPGYAGYSSLLHGAPWLRCSAGWGMVLLNEIQPSHKELHEHSLVGRERSIWVDWGNRSSLDQTAKLVIRHRGEEIAAVVGNV